MTTTQQFHGIASHGFYRIRCLKCDTQIGSFSTGYDWTDDANRCQRDHVCKPSPTTPTHTPGALRAANSLIAAGYVPGVSFSTRDNVISLMAEIIDRETSAPELLAALEGLIETFQIVREYACGTTEAPALAVVRWAETEAFARAAIARAKGEQ